MTITQAQERIASIYKKHNTSLNYDYDFYYGYLSYSLASGFKMLRNQGDPSEQFCKAVSYIFDMAELCNMDFQTHFLKRFSGICPYCLCKQCVCFQTDKNPPYNLNVTQKKYSEEIQAKYDVFIREIYAKGIEVDFDFVAQMINNIFPLNKIYWNIYNAPKHHIDKIFEELGEVQDAYSRYISKGDNYKRQLQDELCDLFAWIMSAWKLAKPDPFSITDYFIKKYKNGCEKCEADECKCPSRQNRSDLIWNKEEMEYLFSLIEKWDSGNEEVKALQNEYMEALKTNTTTEFKICIRKTIDLLSLNQTHRANKNVDEIERVANLLRAKI